MANFPEALADWVLTLRDDAECVVVLATRNQSFVRLVYPRRQMATEKGGKKREEA